MKKITVLLGLSALIFTGCKKDDEPVPVTFTLDGPSTLAFAPGQTQVFDYTATGDYTLAFTQPEGWIVEESDGTIAITAPAADNVQAEFRGEVKVEAFAGDRSIFTYTTSVSALTILTFENVPAASLAGPTAYGENLYPDHDGFISSYTDPVTGLNFSVPYDYGYGYGGFMMGGAAISRWNDMTTEGYTNQCSVWYSDPATGKGGHNGSQTFSVVYAAIGWGPDYPTYIEFEDEKEKVIDHLYISNGTYPVLSMTHGDGFARALDYEHQDWFTLRFQGYNAAGEAVGDPIDYDLADFRTPQGAGIVAGWHKVDLSPMGKVNRIVFTMGSSNDGGFGNNVKTPAYFCIDDIAVRQ